MSSEKIIAEINGLTIRDGVVYKVLHKADTNKLDSFVEEGATKLPSEGISDLFQCGYVSGTNGAKGVWDTGFYAESPCYAGKDDKEVKEIVKSLKTNIVDPFERKYGKGVLSHENDSFWIERYFTLTEGLIFRVNDVDDLLSLYMAMRTFKLTPIELTKDLRFRNSMYCVQDETKVRNRNMERIADEMTVIGLFTTLNSTDVNKLRAIMTYVGFSAFDFGAENRTKMGMFGNWLKNDRNNVSAFLDAYDLIDDKKTADELYIYAKLPAAVKKKIIEREQGAYVYMGDVVGGDLKTVAKRLNNDPNLEELKLKILELS